MTVPSSASSLQIASDPTRCARARYWPSPSSASSASRRSVGPSSHRGDALEGHVQLVHCCDCAGRSWPHEQQLEGAAYTPASSSKSSTSSSDRPAARVTCSEKEHSHVRAAAEAVAVLWKVDGQT